MIYNPENQADIDKVSDFLNTLLRSAVEVDRTPAGKSRTSTFTSTFNNLTNKKEPMDQELKKEVASRINRLKENEFRLAFSKAETKSANEIVELVEELAPRCRVGADLEPKYRLL